MPYGWPSCHRDRCTHDDELPSFAGHAVLETYTQPGGEFAGCSPIQGSSVPSWQFHSATPSAHRGPAPQDTSSMNRAIILLPVTIRKISDPKRTKLKQI